LNDAPLGLLFAILAGLILLSGFFSSSETGMMALNRYRLKHLQQQGHKGALRAGKLLTRPDRLIGLILIGNNLVNILASAIATVVAIRLYGDAGIAIATITLTIVILIFAEITPKTIAALHPEKVAFPASVILLPLMKLIMPLVWAINAITNSLLSLFGFKADASSEDALTQEELRTIVNESSGLIPRRHRNMLVNILDLEQVTVNDIMVPRNEIYGIDLEDDDETILSRLTGSTHTLVPVFKGDINKIEGVLHLRHIGRCLNEGKLDRSALLRELQEPYFTPENTALHIQLRHFQQRKLRLGMIVDEYGDILGLVALEDILEEIVGNFTSNLVEDQEEIATTADGGASCTGSIPIRDINRQFDWELPTNGPKTISGLALEALEAFPMGPASVKIGNYQLDVESIEGNAITQVKVTPLSFVTADDD
jgi:Mg2+/Co2+ transporter CorB